MKTPIIFSGYNPRGVIAFLRTLEKNKIAYAIIASSANDDIFLTDYGKKVVATRKHKKLDIDDILKCIELAKKMIPNNKYVVAPSTEALNRFLLENRNKFEGSDCEVPLVNQTLYEKISDKQSFGKICRTHGITVPADSIDIPKEYPFVAKPKRYFTNDGKIHSPLLIFDDTQAEDFKKNYNPTDFYYQEYVAGDSLYLLYFFYKNGLVVKLSQQNFVQQPGGKSIIAAKTSDFHESSESTKYEKLFRSLNFSGLVMVEIKRSSEKKYMIEANPRFWGPSQLFVDSGVNLFEDFLFDLGVVDNRPYHDSPEQARYFWEGGLMESDDKEVYHGCSRSEFNQDLSVWQATDIYNREDTKRLYRKEMDART